MIAFFSSSENIFPRRVQYQGIGKFVIALNRAKLLSIEIFSAQITVSSEQGIVYQDWTAAVSCVWVVAAGMSFMDRLSSSSFSSAWVFAATELIRNFSTGSPEIVPTGMVVGKKKDKKP